MHVTSYPQLSHLMVPLAITHVTVIPMDTERILPDQTVLIEDDRIVAMGPASAIPLEAFYTVIDGTDKYLMPGLTDMHVHYWSPNEAALFLAHGVTVVRNMAGNPYHLALQQQLQRKKLPGPLLYTTSPLIEGGPPIHSAWRAMTNADDAAKLVHTYAERGYQQIKIYNQLKPDVVRAMGQAARELGIRMVGHCSNFMTFEEASEAGQSCFEHFTGAWRGHFKPGYEQRSDQYNLQLDVLNMVNEKLDYDAIRRLGHYLAKHQIWNCPTLVCYHYMLNAQCECEADPLLQSFLKYVVHAELKSWEELDPSRYQEPASFDPWIAAIHKRNEAFSRIASLLYQEGAPLLIGTDTSVRYIVQGLSVHQELALFVAAGMRPFEALRCGTSEAARFLDQEDEWGTIKVGKRANMLLLNANPLENIQAASQIEAVCVNGFYLSRKDLDGMLAHCERMAPAGPPQSLPHIVLGNITARGGVVAHGTWREHYMDGETGYLIYRHSHLLDGNWLIEEQHIFEYGELFSQGGQQHRKTRFHLAADGTIRQLSETRESWLGSEQLEITWLKTGAYMIRRKEIDGYEQTQVLTSVPLLAADTLSFTAFLLLIKNNIDLTNRLALSIDETGTHIVSLHGSSAEALSQDGETQWQVQIQRPDLPIQLSINMASNGECLRLEQTGRIHKRVFAAMQS
ncbi:amidohydrolase family protein [Dictyobacter kobayashii]|nr:amidohydrolase family protein [Dictyobacter kobayashii]